jgi:hypothetical protein
MSNNPISLISSFKNVKYKIADTYAYEGDCVFTPTVFYFLPHTNLIQRQINNAVTAVSIAAIAFSPSALGVMGSSSIKELKQGYDKDKEAELKQAKQTIEQLDSYMEKLREKRAKY